jgi:hypothetical protein
VANKNITKDALQLIKKKAGKAISESDIKKLASEVKPSTVQQDAKLRELIKHASSLLQVKVTDQTTQDIIRAVKTSKIDGQNLEQFISMIIGKK